MIVSAGRKAFENLELENYMSDINKNYQVCIPPEHLSLGYSRKKKTKEGVESGISRMKFPGVLVSGLKSSERCNKILWSF